MSALSKQDINASLLDLRTRKTFLDLIEVVTVAAAGTSEANAAKLTGSVNAVTAADGTKGVILPKSKRDTAVKIVNTVVGSNLKVYPDTGGQINALTVTTGAFILAGGSEALFYCDVDLHWYSNERQSVKEISVQVAPTALTTSATLTAAQILTGLLTANQGAAGAASYTLPTGTAFETGLLARSPGLANDDAFDFSLVNISTVAAEDVDILTNTGWTLVGSMAVQSNDAITSKSAGRFRARRTAANTYTLYRIS